MTQHAGLELHPLTKAVIPDLNNSQWEELYEGP